MRWFRERVYTARARLGPGILGLGTVILFGFASPAIAAGPSTRLVTCAEGSCLLVKGRRADATTPVRINGHPVAVEGGRHWRARLPIETVRAWSAPFARTIEVTHLDRGAHQEQVAQADLPIGVLGNVTKLASLVVSIR